MNETFYFCTYIRDIEGKFVAGAFLEDEEFAKKSFSFYKEMLKDHQKPLFFCIIKGFSFAREYLNEKFESIPIKNYQTYKEYIESTYMPFNDLAAGKVIDVR